jgi:hypothetical protein
MMFEPSAEEQKRCFDKGFSKMYFFGGQLLEERRGRPAASPLYELHIIWSQTREPYPLQIEIHQTFNPLKNQAPVLFEGSPPPRFKQSLPNKRYYPSKNKWVFLDDGGTVYVYDPTTYTVKYKAMRSK